MRSFAIVVLLAASATPAAAFGINGLVTGAAGGVHPCNIQVTDRQTGLVVPLTSDTTTISGSYAMTLPNGRYDLTFKPPIGSHIFQGVQRDVRVNSNTVTVNLFLPSGRYAVGRVVDTNGVPQGLTNIRFKDAGGNTPNNVQDDGTNADGTFLTLVDPNVWNVQIIPPLAAHRVPRQFLAQNLTTTDVNLGDVVVDPGFQVNCTVTDGGLFPIANASLVARLSPGGAKQFIPTNSTNAGGALTFVLPPGLWDVTAEPPNGAPYATRTARAVSLAADLTLPNLVLPPGVVLSGNIGGIAGVDVDVDSLPLPARRLETLNDFSLAGGAFSVRVTTGAFRLTFNPPVATRLLPLRVEPVNVTGTTNMGNLTLLPGHWVSATVVEQGTLTPLAGANLDFVRLSDGVVAVTIDDVTNASGFARVVTDTDLYRLRVMPPSADWDTLFIDPFRSLADTVVTLALRRRNVGAPPPRAGDLALAAPWPNPSRGGELNLAFQANGEAELALWDLAGRRLASAWRGTLHGATTLRWSPRDARGGPLAAGVYWLRLASADAVVTRRIALLP